MLTSCLHLGTGWMKNQAGQCGHSPSSPYWTPEQLWCSLALVLTAGTNVCNVSLPGADVFPVVTSGKTQGNAMMLHQGRFSLGIRKRFTLRGCLATGTGSLRKL